MVYKLYKSSLLLPVKLVKDLSYVYQVLPLVIPVIDIKVWRFYIFYIHTQVYLYMR